MKLHKSVASVTLVSSLLFGGLSVAAEESGSAFEELDRLGIGLNHYIVDKVYTTGYRASGADGSVIRFKNEDVEVELVKGDRIRTFTQDGDFLMAEVVEPELVRYKVVSKFISGGYTYYTAESKNDGLIQFDKDDALGNKIDINDYVIAEFDTRYIENGLVVVYEAVK